MRKDFLQGIMVLVSPKKIKSEKRFMHASFLRILRVGVRTRMLRPEMWLVPAVTSLNVDEFDVLVKIPWQFLAVSSASRHC